MMNTVKISDEERMVVNRLMDELQVSVVKDSRDIEGETVVKVFPYDSGMYVLLTHEWLLCVSVALKKDIDPAMFRATADFNPGVTLYALKFLGLIDNDTYVAAMDEIETLKKIKEAINRQSVVHFRFDAWGIMTSLSDDGSTVYYKRNGTGLAHSNTTVDQVILPGMVHNDRAV